MLNASLYLIVFFLCLLGMSYFFSKYMVKVFNKDMVYLKFIETFITKFVNLKYQMNWKEYLNSLLLFNFCGIIVLFSLLIFQDKLPFNPNNIKGMTWDLALNTTISFVTNTNWQSYNPETDVSHLSQFFGLAVQNFLSSATGMSVLFVLIRSFIYSETKIIGNFFEDILRIILYILMPLSIIFSIILVSCGSPQNFKGYVEAKLINQFIVKDNNIVHHITKQIIPTGPVASQEAIKILGDNGGGVFTANSAHPFENPSSFSNFMQMLFMLLIPSSSILFFGIIIRNIKHGVSLYIVVLLIFVLCYYLSLNTDLIKYISAKFPAINQNITKLHDGGNMLGKEVRFGMIGSHLYSIVATATSCGAVNSAIDSYSPLAGMLMMILIQLDEIIFGGVGAGLYSMIIMVILSVFICGLMIGRTPEYLGKKIESFEIKMIVVITLFIPLLILIFTSIACVLPIGYSQLANRGPHGLSEIIYAFTSTTHGNGSGFAGINSNTIFYNLLLSVCMFVGRFGIIAGVLAVSGRIVQKKILPVNSGTMPISGVTFISIFISIVTILAALTYLPALSLGPIIEQLMIFN